MADKKNLCAMIPADLHARVRLEQEQSGKTLSEFVEQLITDYYKMKEGTKMTGDMSCLLYTSYSSEATRKVCKMKHITSKKSALLIP